MRRGRENHLTEAGERPDMCLSSDTPLGTSQINGQYLQLPAFLFLMYLSFPQILTQVYDVRNTNARYSVMRMGSGVNREWDTKLNGSFFQVVQRRNVYLETSTYHYSQIK